MKKNILLLVLVLLLPALYIKAQSVKVFSGKIIDLETGEPVSGVSVKVLNPLHFVIGDSTGHFNIEAGVNDTLEFSHVGYKTQRSTISRNTQSFTIFMEKSASIMENVLINTGYQQLKPNESNGSYVVIDNKMLNRQSGMNILDRLNGVTSGLLVNVGKSNNNPQNNTNISIRGLSTINGPLDPLIVVDNFIYEGNLRNINPNDVERITVLKDAAASSIWGARAGNGVIVITTKKGKFNQKLQVDFNTDVILSAKPNLYYNPEISSSDYIGFEQILFNKGYYNSQFTNRSHPALSPAMQIFKDRKNGLISAEDSASQINALKKVDNRQQYTNYFYKRRFTQQYALNLHGGSQNLAWLISGDYDKDINSLRAQYNKINLRFENTYRPIKKLTINTGIYYANSTNTSGISPFNSVSQINNTRYVPYIDLLGANGTSVPVIHSYDQRYIDTAGEGYLRNWNYYPLEDYKHIYGKTNIEELIAHVNFDYQIIRGLDVSFMYQYDKQNTTQTNTQDTASYYTRNLINLFSQIDRTTGIVTYIVPPGGILNKSYTSLNAYNFRGQLNFGKTFNVIHKVNAIAGFELREQRSESNGATYYGYNADPLINSSNLDYANTYPTFITNSPAYIPYGNNLTATDNRFVSFYTNVSYQYKERYTLSASMRKDGSNIFGANTNDKWQPLWSSGFGWELSKEPFYAMKWLSFLRLSVTYGVGGNVDLSKTAMPIGMYYSQAVGTTQLQALGISEINNPNLSWERSYQTNFRIDFRVFKNILNGSIEYYRKRGTHLYAPTLYDYTAWGKGATIISNAADMKGNGIDISLYSINIDRKFKWKTSFIYNYNRSETTKYYSDAQAPLGSFLGIGKTITPVVGKPLYAIAVYRWGGLDNQGSPQGYLNDTLSTDYRAIANSGLKEGFEGGSIAYIGSATPEHYGAVMNEFEFKGFSLSFNITYKFGYYFMRPALSYTGLATNGTGGADYVKRWQQPGDENTTTVPSFVYPLNDKRDAFYNGNEINIEKGGQVRLQFVNFSYSFLNNNARLPFTNVELYLNAANLGLIWRANHDHIDPDNVSSIPNPKVVTCGLRANF